MKNKGFTLIELLAVIVILAIIAVITVPIISDTMEKSRKDAAKDSTYGYVDAVNRLYYSKSLNNEDDVEDGIYTVSQLKTVGVSVNGSEPSDGWVELENNEVVAYSIKIGKYVITKYRNSELVCEKGDVQPDESTKQQMELQAEISEKVDSYVKATLTANSSITGETVKTVSEMSSITTNPADSGWIHFSKVNDNVVVVDYSLTYGDLTANYSSLTNGNYVSTFGEARKKPVIVGSNVCYGPTGSQECFKVISTNSSTTLLFANYNLKEYTDNTTNPVTVTYKQESSSPDQIAFSNSTNKDYWWEQNTYQLKSKYAKDINGNAASYSGNPYPYIYDSNSLTYAYIEGYLTTLKAATYGLPSSATGRLLTKEEASNPSMFADDTARTNGKYYWLGSVGYSTGIWIVNDNGGFNYGNYSFNGCVRPVIVISTSDI